MPYAPRTIRDIQGYTFVLTNVYPVRNYETVEPLSDYKTIVDSSRLFGSYDDHDMSSYKIIFPTQAFYAADEESLALTPPPPKPQFMPYELLPAEEIDGVPIPYVNTGAHTQLVINMMPVQLPTLTSAGFLDHSRGFGWAVALETQVWQNYNYQKNIAESTLWEGVVESADELDINYYYSNVDQVQQWILNAHTSGYTAPIVQVRVLHNAVRRAMTDALLEDEGSPFDASDGYGILGYGSAYDSTGGVFSDEFLDARHQQLLFRFKCHPYNLFNHFSRDDPTVAEWARNPYADTWRDTLGLDQHLAPELSTYAYVWEKVLTDYATGAPESGLGVLTRAVFRAGSVGYYGHEQSSYKNTYLNKMFPSLESITTGRDEYVSSRVSYFSALLGNTFQVPKEFRAKRQLSPNRLQTKVTSLGPGTTYVTSTETSSPSMPAGGGSTGGY